MKISIKFFQITLIAILSFCGSINAQTKVQFSSNDCGELVKSINSKSKNPRYNSQPELYVKEVLVPTISEYLERHYGNANVTETERKNLINQASECITNALNSENSYNNTKCMFAENIKKPNLNFFIIDDRKLCICCNARYRRYKLNDLEDLKRSEEVNFLNARLEEHLSKTSADENHQLSDKSNLQAYLALNYGMVGYAGSLLSDALSPLMALLGGVLDLPDPLSRDRKIYRYKIVSDYCSKKCEIYCSR